MENKILLEAPLSIRKLLPHQVKEIAANISDFAGNWEMVWDNIMLRAQCNQALLEIAEKAQRPELLEADFVVEMNDMFHKLLDKVKREVGKIDSKRIFFDFNEWLKKEVKKKK